MAAAIGGYRATGSTVPNGASVDLTALFGRMVETGQAAGAASARLQQLSELIALLGAGTVGGVRTVGTDLTKLTALALNARA